MTRKWWFCSVGISNFLSKHLEQETYGLKQDRDPHAHRQGDGKQDHVVPVSQYAVIDPESGQNQCQQPGAETGQPVQDI